MITLSSMQTQLENHFHFSPPTTESFILFHVNDMLHHTALTSSAQQHGPHTSSGFQQSKTEY